jgi:DNA modification methylase
VPASGPQNRRCGNGRASGNKTHKGVTEYERSDSEEHRTKAGLLKIAETPYALRNKRSVWTVSTQAFPEAHFATFPPALIEPCILAGCPKGGTVLDPFGGAGTTGLVADRLQRSAILIELNPTYAAMAQRRICGDSPLFTQAAAE